MSGKTGCCFVRWSLLCPSNYPAISRLRLPDGMPRRSPRWMVEISRSRLRFIKVRAAKIRIVTFCFRSGLTMASIARNRNGLSGLTKRVQKKVVRQKQISAAKRRGCVPGWITPGRYGRIWQTRRSPGQASSPALIIVAMPPRALIERRGFTSGMRPRRWRIAALRWSGWRSSGPLRRRTVRSTNCGKWWRC